ncbi:hypothetical protein KSP35_11515 [Aquihabitans sp. G128]|uniref:hypothetical protein n=1 Tax=Aquihabitans sp. G128 TaxID=2849779 RepID=UPI001C23F94C|nr:hypothetical protein [Aquihabitans sp. G128]QXC63355.1 hypothetical protein KSP35_11515 [Aquihabitans sp. G128]
MGERTWRIDAGVARDLAEALGWAGGDGPAALAVRLPERVPTGSTAKLAAVAAGEVPPGADVDALAKQVLAHQLAIGSAPPGGAPSPSWSCWVLATVMAALVDYAEVGPVRVAATRRIDEGAPVVDVHAAVVADVEGTTWACDPFFGIGLPIPTAPDEVVEGTAGPCWAALGPEPDHGWDLSVRLDHWGTTLRYRVLGPALDRGDVHALAAVSVTHTGVANRPFARLHVDGRVVDASCDEDGHGRFTDHPAATEVLPTWADAVDAFAARTGTRPT